MVLKLIMITTLYGVFACCIFFMAANNRNRYDTPRSNGPGKK